MRSFWQILAARLLRGAANSLPLLPGPRAFLLYMLGVGDPPSDADLHALVQAHAGVFYYRAVHQGDRGGAQRLEAIARMLISMAYELPEPLKGRCARCGRHCLGDPLSHIGPCVRDGLTFCSTRCSIRHSSHPSAGVERARVEDTISETFEGLQTLYRSGDYREGADPDAQRLASLGLRSLAQEAETLHTHNQGRQQNVAGRLERIAKAIEATPLEQRGDTLRDVSLRDLITDLAPFLVAEFK